MCIGNRSARERKDGEQRDRVQKRRIGQSAARHALRFPGQDKHEQRAEDAYADAGEPEREPGRVVVLPPATRGMPWIGQGEDVDGACAAVAWEEGLGEGKCDLLRTGRRRQRGRAPHRMGTWRR